MRIFQSVCVLAGALYCFESVIVPIMNAPVTGLFWAGLCGFVGIMVLSGYVMQRIWSGKEN